MSFIPLTLGLSLSLPETYVAGQVAYPDRARGRVGVLNRAHAHEGGRGAPLVLSLLLSRNPAPVLRPCLVLGQLLSPGRLHPTRADEERALSAIAVVITRGVWHVAPALALGPTPAALIVRVVVDHLCRQRRRASRAYDV